MPKYKVRIRCEGYWDVWIEADNATRAMERAVIADWDEIVDMDIEQVTLAELLREENDAEI